MVLLTDALGAKVQTYTYDAWGAPSGFDVSGFSLQVSAFSSRFLYTGREYDIETALYHYRARAYSSTLGRFLQPDPIDFCGGDGNLFRYVANNPINLSDSLGLWGIGWGDSSGNVSWNIGVGTPSLLFTPESGMDVSMAAAATLDGINPFGNPLADMGAYDECDPVYQGSRFLGFMAAAAYTGRLYTPPSTLYHHTSQASAAGIAATGGIQASSAGIRGMGTYLSSSPSPFIATLQGAGQTGAVVPVSSAGLGLSRTIVPGSFVVRRASVLVP